MSAISYIIFAILGIAFVALALFFLLLISRNVVQGKMVREKLAKRVEELRMSKMLRALGLDFSKYLYSVPIHKINESMKKCETCSTTDQCDAQLKQETTRVQDVDFCPNQACLGKFTELTRSST
jgi:HAMP domain-containing protein